MDDNRNQQNHSSQEQERAGRNEQNNPQQNMNTEHTQGRQEESNWNDNAGNISSNRDENANRNSSGESGGGTLY